MLVLKYFLFVAAAALFAGAAALLLYDLFRLTQRFRATPPHSETEPGRVLPAARPLEIRWPLAVKLAGLAWLPLLAGLSIVVVPSGQAGVRVSQFSGTRPGTLHPGVHLVRPLVERIALFDIRDRVYSTSATLTEPAEAHAAAASAGPFTVQTKEGLSLGLAIAVRYKLDAQRLDHIHASLPQPVEQEIVPPVVASVFRQVVPNYTVREVFAAKREEVRQRAAEAITARLGEDGVLVKEVMLRDIQLPAEYAKGLEGLLLKEQENEQLTYEIAIKEKRVRTAELEAEAQKTREIKRAEGDAKVVVIRAKAEADAMQHTLPLKEKQIQQSRLEAQARKEARLQDAQAAAEAKVIDSRAELERRKFLAEAEANRIRVTSAADAERLKLEALVLKQNPLLIQKIIAERLSDKVQIMMVPTDGKFFFANDVLRAPQFATAPSDPDDAGSSETARRRPQ
jgi:regulator of protease activity HflC (stomatin/prohibitin superfamily)